MGRDSPEQSPGPRFHLPLRLTLLGEVSLVSARGRRVPVPHGKPLAVLAYLALHPEGVTRDRLAELLWGDKPLTKARHSVRQALSGLTGKLGDDLFVSTAPVRLVPGVVVTDLHEFRQAVEEGALDRAMELWGGDPFADLGRVDEVSWNRWVDEIAASARRILVTALEERSRTEVAAGRIDLAVALLEEATRLDPERAESWARLAEVQLDHGRVREARTTLADAWSALTPAVYESHLAEHEQRVSLGPDAVRVDEDDRIVARERDLAVAAEAWRSARSARTEVVVFSGAAGLGKTRLLREIASPQVTPGATIVDISVEPTGPYGLLRECVGRLGALQGAGDVSRESGEVLGALHAGEIRDDGGPTDAEIADAFLDLLVATASNAPLMLLLDDVHHADLPSWRVVGRLVRVRPGHPVLLCMSIDPGASDLDIRTDIQRWIERDRAFLRGLRAFTREETASLVRRYGWREGDRVTAEIFEATDGHPALVMGFLEAARGAGEAAAALGQEPPDEDLELDTLPLSDDLRERYRSRIHALPPEADGVIHNLSRSTRVTLPTLAYAMEMDDPDLRDLTERMTEAGLVRPSEDGEGIALVHPGIARLIAEPGTAEARWDPPLPPVPPEEWPQPEDWSNRTYEWRSNRNPVLFWIQVVVVLGLLVWSFLIVVTGG